MAEPQIKPKEYNVPLRRRSRRRSRSVYLTAKKINAAKLASSLQLQEDQRELTYSKIALFIKSGLLVIAFASSLKLGLASHQRVNRNREINNVLQTEIIKLQHMQKRFDSLFSIGGEDRLMEEQDQWITPNSKRIIWQ